MKTKNLPDCVRPKAPTMDIIRTKIMHDQILVGHLEKVNEEPEFIGQPMGFQHNCHVEIDPSTEFGLRGLPEEWQMYLETSGLTKEQIKMRPKEVLNVLLVSTGNKQALPPKKEVERQMKEVLNFRTEDPSDFYDFEARIGKGGQGLVFEALKKGEKDKIYAVKMMKITDRGVEYKIKKEIAIGFLATSPYVVEFYETFKFKG